MYESDYKDYDITLSDDEAKSLKIRALISGRLHMECPYYTSKEIRWMPLNPYLTIEGDGVLDNSYLESPYLASPRYIVDTSLSPSDIFLDFNVLGEEDSLKRNAVKWYLTYTDLLEGTNECVRVPFKPIDKYVQLLSNHYYSGKPIRLIEGVFINNVIKATSYGTTIFDADVYLSPQHKENIIIKVTTLYRPSNEIIKNGKRIVKHNMFDVFYHDILSNAPSKEQMMGLGKIQRQYDQAGLPLDKERCSLFPHHAEEDYDVTHTVYLHEAWQEIVAAINIFPSSFYGHINVIDPETRALYCVLFMKKYHSTFYHLQLECCNEFSKIDETSQHVSTENKRLKLEIFPRMLHALLIQTIFILLPHLKSYYNFCHNDMKADNITYVKTKQKYIYLYLRYGKEKYKLLKVPTFNRRVELIDAAFSYLVSPVKKKNKSISKHVYYGDKRNGQQISPLYLNHNHFRRGEYDSHTPPQQYQSEQGRQRKTPRVAFCSRNIFENLGYTEYMNYRNTYTDIGQMGYSIIRLLEQFRFLADKCSPTYDTMGWRLLSSLLNDICMLDSNLGRSYMPILKNCIDLKRKNRLKPGSLLSSYKEKTWSNEMYTVISECCTFSCPKRQEALFNHLLYYEVMDKNEIMEVLEEYTVIKNVNGVRKKHLKSKYPYFVMMTAPTIDNNARSSKRLAREEEYFQPVYEDEYTLPDEKRFMDPGYVRDDMFIIPAFQKK